MRSRLDLRDAAGADRLLDGLERRVADRLPVDAAGAGSPKRSRRREERHVTIAVVGALREHSQDQLIERAARAAARSGRRRSRAGARERVARGRRAGAAGGDPARRYPRACAMAEVEHHTDEIDGVPVELARGARRRHPDALRPRRARQLARAGRAFLARTGGVALDLPGFGDVGQGRHVPVLDRRLRRLHRALPRLARARARRARRCTTGAPPRSPSPSARRSASSGSC